MFLCSCCAQDATEVEKVEAVETKPTPAASEEASAPPVEEAAVKEEPAPATAVNEDPPVATEDTATQKLSEEDASVPPVVEVAAQEDAATLDEKFNGAAGNAKAFKKLPADSEMLLLYALYKQGSTGDVQTKRPGWTDLKGKAKWDAWNKQKGRGSDDAKSDYIALVDKLGQLYGYRSQVGSRIPDDEGVVEGRWATARAMQYASTFTRKVIQRDD